MILHDLLRCVSNNILPGGIRYARLKIEAGLVAQWVFAQ